MAIFSSYVSSPEGNIEISGVMLAPISATSTSLTFGCGPLNYVSTFPSNYPKMCHGRTLAEKLFLIGGNSRNSNFTRKWPISQSGQ